MGERRATLILFMILCSILISLTLISSVGASSELWSQTYGGEDRDICTSMVQTDDGGFALVGSSLSFGTGAWLVKTDQYGNMQWNRTYDGIENEGAFSLIQTGDGGFAFVGQTSSTVEGYIPVGSMPEGYWSFVWLVKTDEYGNMGWNQTYDGETGYYYGSSLVQTTDGGYALAGNSFSYWGEEADLLLIKTDPYGNLEWSKSYGGSGREQDPYGLVQTSDGGFALVCKTFPYGESYVDVLFIKTDDSGNMEWNKTHGGVRMDYPSSLVQLFDGNFVLAGCTDSFGDRGYDFWLIKTDIHGNVKWNQTYGTENQDVNPSLVVTSDGGFALAGFTHADLLAGLLLVKTDSQGNMLWSQTYPGTSVLGSPSLIQTVEGGFALSGSKRSFDSGDYDYWLVKTDACGIPEFHSWTILPLFMIVTMVVIIIKKHGF